MNKKNYSHILDAAARDQVPPDLDLAPEILARINKKRGFKMHPRTRFLSAAVIVAILMVVLFYTVPGVAAAIGRWFGYMPNVGFVNAGQIRVLERPVSLTRENITLTVEQVVIDPERTTLVYSVNDIPDTAISTNPSDPLCPYQVLLRLPDGSSSFAGPSGLQSSGPGYRHRLEFPLLPADVNEVTLVVPCLFNTRTGAAPENWEIALEFVPAPADMTVFPVIEISTATPVPTLITPEPDLGSDITKTEVSAQPFPVTLTMDRAVKMDDSYLIYATLQWKDTPFAAVDISDLTETLHLQNASGQEIGYEPQYDDQTGVNIDQRQTVFAIKTAPLQTTDLLTLVLDSVVVDMPVNASFVFDPGADPQTGQSWTLNKDVKIGEYNLRIRTATAEMGGYSFEMSSDNGILNATLVDMEHPVVSGGGGGGGGKPGEAFFYSFNYADPKLPNGPVTVTISSISFKHVQRLDAQWTPPGG